MWFLVPERALVGLLVFLFSLSSMVGFVMDDPDAEQPKKESLSDVALLAQYHNPTTKTSDENWEQYMLRMLKAKVCDDSTFRKWQVGEGVSFEREYTLEESRFETRFTKQPSPDGKKTVKSEPRTVEVPYTTRIVDQLEVPASGDAAENAVLEGFFSDQRRRVPKTEASIAAEDHWSAKRSDENWEQYVERLRKNGAVAEQERKRWLAGNSINLVRSMRARRYVPKKCGDLKGIVGVRKNANEDAGTKVSLEPMGEQYIVLIAVIEEDLFHLRLPARGKAARDATNKGFRSLVGERPLTESRPSGFEARPPLSGEKKLAILTCFTSKKENESWDVYAQRMAKHGVISPSELASWKSGDKIINRMKVELKGFREEKRSRRVNVLRKVDGEEDVEEAIDQTYVVKVPFSLLKEGAFKLPQRGSKPDDADNRGYLFRTINDSK